MVVAARIQWIREQVDAGIPTHVTFGSAAESERGKCKVVLAHGGPPSSALARSLLMNVLTTLEQMTLHTHTVDRGHKHTDGKSEVSFWFSQVRGVPPGPPDQLPPHDGPDDDESFHRRDRGRSPPGPRGDPWQAPGSDPWSSSVGFQGGPVRKAPRRRTALQRSTWHPSSSSATPDPPVLRRRSSTILQNKSSGKLYWKPKSIAVGVEPSCHTTVSPLAHRVFGGAVRSLDGGGWASLHARFADHLREVKEPRLWQDYQAAGQAYAWKMSRTQQMGPLVRQMCAESYAEGGMKRHGFDVT